MNNSRIVKECCRCLGFLSGHFTPSTAIFRETIESTSSPELMRSFPTTLQLNWTCRLPRLSDILGRNSFEMTNYPVSMRSLAALQDSRGSLWLEGLTSNCLVLVVTLYQPQWPCLQIIVLLADTWKECFSHLTTFAMDADPLRTRRLSSTFLVSARLFSYYFFSI